MTWREYHLKPNSFWRGRRVISLQELQSRAMRIPAGTTFAILRKYGGFDLETDACASCGVSIFIRKVPPHCIKLLPE